MDWLDSIRFRWWRWLNVDEKTGFDYWLSERKGEKLVKLESMIDWTYLHPDGNVQWDDIYAVGSPQFRIIGRMRAALEYSLSPGVHKWAGLPAVVLYEDYISVEDVNAAARLLGIYGVFVPTNK